MHVYVCVNVHMCVCEYVKLRVYLSMRVGGGCGVQRSRLDALPVMCS